MAIIDGPTWPSTRSGVTSASDRSLIRQVRWWREVNHASAVHRHLKAKCRLRLRARACAFFRRALDRQGACGSTSPVLSRGLFLGRFGFTYYGRKFPITMRGVTPKSWYSSGNMRGRTTSRIRPAFGMALATARAQHGMTQADLARKLGVDRTLIRYYEREAKNPKIEIVQKCAAALEMPMAGLLAGGGPAISGRISLLERFVQRLQKLDPVRRNFAVKIFSSQLPLIAQRRRQPNGEGKK